MKIIRENFFTKIFFVLIALTWAVTATAEDDQKAQQSVATVNGVDISSKEYNRAMASAKQQFSQVGMQEDNAEHMASLKKMVMEQIINSELFYQQSQKQGITVEDNEVDQTLENLKKQLPDDAAYQSFLTSSSISEAELKGQIRRNLSMQKLQLALQVEFAETAVVSDTDAKEFYTSNVDKFKTPERAQASHILISVAEDADEAARKEAKSKIEDIQKKLKEGEDFAELAKTYSGCPSGSNGGDLGMFARGQMVKPFEDAAFSMEPGDVSDIVETKFGYHLIKLTDKQAAGTMEYAEIQEKLKAFLKQQKMEEKIKTYIADLNKNAKIVYHEKVD